MKEITHSDNQKNELLNNKIIRLFGEINEESVGATIDLIILAHNKGIESITLYINSSGGDLLAAMSLHATISNSAINITGISLYSCSAAIFILLACHKRKALSCSELLFHDVLIDEEIDKIKFIKSSKEGSFQHCRDMIFSKCNLTKKQFELLMIMDFPILAEQALKFGFIDEVLPFKLCTKSKNTSKDVVEIQNHEMGCKYIGVGIAVMRSYSLKPKYILNINILHICDLILLQSSKWRMVKSNSLIVLGFPRIEIQYSYLINSFHKKIIIDKCNILIEVVIDILFKSSKNLNKTQIRNMLKTIHILTPNKALKLGLVDEVIK